MTIMTGWQAVVRTLQQEGVKYLFGMPTSPEIFTMPYMTPQKFDLSWFDMRAEDALWQWAMRLRMVSRRFVLLVAVQELQIWAPVMLEALATCAPVIALASVTDGHIDGKGAFQETDQIGLIRPLTKWAFHVPYAENIPWVMRRAFSLATNGQPGPIFIELPKEVGRLRYEVPNYISPQRNIRTAGDPTLIEQAVAMLTEAKRPLIVAGGGARHSGADDFIKALAELLGMPVMTTPSGRGIIPEDHPLAIGQVGLYRTRLGMQAFAEADLLITVGSRNEEFQTGAWRIFPSGAKFIQIDIETFEIGRNWIPDLAIVGDAKLVISEIHRGIQSRVDPAWQKRYQVWRQAKRGIRK